MEEFCVSAPKKKKSELGQNLASSLVNLQMGMVDEL